MLLRCVELEWLVQLKWHLQVQCQNFHAFLCMKAVSKIAGLGFGWNPALVNDSFRKASFKQAIDLDQRPCLGSLFHSRPDGCNYSSGVCYFEMRCVNQTRRASQDHVPFLTHLDEHSALAKTRHPEFVGNLRVAATRPCITSMVRTTLHVKPA